MYKFQELRKASKSLVNGKEFRIAVLGNVATQFLSTSICGYGKKEGINLMVFDSDYNQIDVQLLDPASEIYQFKPDAILLFLATDKLYEAFLDEALVERRLFADRMILKLERYWDLIEKNSNSRIMQMNFTEIDDEILGSYSSKTDISFIYQLRKLNYLLEERMSIHKGVYPIDLLSVQIALGQHVFYDPVLYYNAKMAIHMDALPAVAKKVIDVVKAMQGKMKKCIVLDLDNTLWGGVIGDDGLGGIEIGELGRGHAFADFQRWLKQMKDRGILLAVCSKNNEETAREPFEKHEEMILHMDDFSIFVANWNDKVSNIKLIQQNLNIGMDSLVFLDDNPFERHLVKSMIPDITVPELPEDPALYLQFLQENNLFEAVSYSDEEHNRTEQYQAESKRKALAQTFESIDAYLKGLEMIGEAKSFEPNRYARIAQLTQRSNQFNLRTIRYTEDAIARIAQDGNYITRYYTLKDKFGDHGLVSVIILKKESDTQLFVDTWLMSCRVLKRGMEEFTINKMVEAAQDNGFETICAEYIPTLKNSMVKNIYDLMGFTPVGDGKYKLKVSEYKKQPTFIMEGY